MSLYNMLFGRNEHADLILLALGWTTDNVKRFRNAYVVGNEIAIYTRCGGGNREHWDASYEGNPGETCECPGCWITYIAPKHPNYLRDEDDDFDSTYATVYFSIPEDFKLLLLPMSQEEWSPSKEWEETLERLQTEGPTEREKEVFTRIVEKIKTLIKNGG